MVFSLHCTSNGYQKQTNKQQQQQNWLKTKQSKLAKKQNMEGLGTWEGKTIAGAKWQQVVKQSSASAPCSSPLLSAFLFLFFPALFSLHKQGDIYNHSLPQLPSPRQMILISWFHTVEFSYIIHLLITLVNRALNAWSTDPDITHRILHGMGIIQKEHLGRISWFLKKVYMDY